MEININNDSIVDTLYDSIVRKGLAYYMAKYYNILGMDNYREQ